MSLTSLFCWSLFIWLLASYIASIWIWLNMQRTDD